MYTHKIHPCTCMYMCTHPHEHVWVTSTHLMIWKCSKAIVSRGQDSSILKFYRIKLSKRPSCFCPRKCHHFLSETFWDFPVSWKMSSPGQLVYVLWCIAVVYVWVPGWACRGQVSMRYFVDSWYPVLRWLVYKSHSEKAQAFLCCFSNPKVLLFKSMEIKMGRRKWTLRMYVFTVSCVLTLGGSHGEAFNSQNRFFFFKKGHFC